MKSLEGRLDALRRDFREARAKPPNKYHELNQGYELTDGKELEGLFEGIQRNVFLYIDKKCVDSVLDGPRWMDDSWIWAVDPDYTPNSHERDGYKGYLRVRLQQILHRFYEARRFYADELPMEYLWRAAQKKPRNQAFVSVCDDEASAWNADKYTGSALRRKP